MNRSKEKLLLFFSILVIWVSISSASVLVVLSQAPAEACAFWRLFLSLPLLFIVGLLNGRSSSIRSIKLHHMVSGLSLSLHFALWMHSLILIPIYVSTLLVTMYPLYSLMIELALTKRKPSIIQIAGIFLCSILLAMLLGVNELVFNMGALEAFIAGLFAAVYFVSGHYARSKLKESTVDYAIKSYFVAAIATMLIAFLKGVELIRYDAYKYMYFLLMAIIPMMFGHTLMNFLLEKYSASIVTSVSYGEPFGAGLLAYFILGQEITMSQIILGLAIMITVFITVSSSNINGLSDKFESFNQPCKH
jgi:drug/metabolite transporter (DMT)-like permease